MTALAIALVQGRCLGELIRDGDAVCGDPRLGGVEARDRADLLIAIALHDAAHDGRGPPTGLVVGEHREEIAFVHPADGGHDLPGARAERAVTAGTGVGEHALGADLLGMDRQGREHPDQESDAQGAAPTGSWHGTLSFGSTVLRVATVGKVRPEDHCCFRGTLNDSRGLGLDSGQGRSVGPGTRHRTHGGDLCDESPFNSRGIDKDQSSINRRRILTCIKVARRSPRHRPNR